MKVSNTTNDSPQLPDVPQSLEGFLFYCSEDEQLHILIHILNLLKYVQKRVQGSEDETEEAERSGREGNSKTVLCVCVYVSHLSLKAIWSVFTLMCPPFCIH